MVVVRIKLDGINKVFSTMPGTDNRYPINVLYCYFLHYNFIAFQLQLRYYWVCRLFLEVYNLREVNDSGHCNKHAADNVLETW